MGISVKSRSRGLGKEETHVRIPNDDFEKVRKACEAFGCEPYFAIVTDAAGKIRAFILPMEHLQRIFPPAKTMTGWKMTEKYLQQYYADPRIMIFELCTSTIRWW